MATKQPNIIQIIENAEDLPALPHTIAKLFKLANDPDVSLYTVSKLIENDAAMSVRVLKTVNSEIYRFNNEIKNVKQAVSILGIKALRNVAFTVAMLDIFPNVTPKLI